MRRAFSLVLTGVLVVLGSNVRAAPAAFETDLGVMGPTYEIREPDLLEEIHNKLLAKQASGELARMQDEGHKRAMASVREPKPIDGVSKTMVARTRYWDPSIVIQENIVDEKGRVLVPKGTVANPLDHMQMSKSMLFFDARDPDQVAYARQALSKVGTTVTPILVGGAVIDLMKQWKTRLYFDQQGTLVKKFGIKQVPAWVYQEGRVMRIDEVLAVN